MKLGSSTCDGAGETAPAVVAAADEPLGFDFGFVGRTVEGVVGPAAAAVLFADALLLAGALLFDPTDCPGVVPVGVRGGRATVPRPFGPLCTRVEASFVRVAVSLDEAGETLRVKRKSTGSTRPPRESLFLAADALVGPARTFFLPDGVGSGEGAAETPAEATKGFFSASTRSYAFR